MSDSKLFQKIQDYFLVMVAVLASGFFLHGQRNIFVVSDKKGWSHDRGVSM